MINCRWHWLHSHRHPVATRWTAPLSPDLFAALFDCVHTHTHTHSCVMFWFSTEADPARLRIDVYWSVMDGWLVERWLKCRKPGTRQLFLEKKKRLNLEDCPQCWIERMCVQCVSLGQSLISTVLSIAVQEEMRQQITEARFISALASLRITTERMISTHVVTLVRGCVFMCSFLHCEASERLPWQQHGRWRHCTIVTSLPDGDSCRRLPVGSQACGDADGGRRTTSPSTSFILCNKK